MGVGPMTKGSPNWKLAPALQAQTQGLIASGFNTMPYGQALLLTFVWAPGVRGGAWLAALGTVVEVQDGVSGEDRKVHHRIHHRPSAGPSSELRRTGLGEERPERRILEDRPGEDRRNRHHREGRRNRHHREDRPGEGRRSRRHREDHRPGEDHLGEHRRSFAGASAEPGGRRSELPPGFASCDWGRGRGRPWGPFEVREALLLLCRFRRWVGLGYDLFDESFNLCVRALSEHVT